MKNYIEPPIIINLYIVVLSQGTEEKRQWECTVVYPLTGINNNNNNNKNYYYYY